MLSVGAAHLALGKLLVQPQLALLGVQLQLRLSALGKARCRSPGREPNQHPLCFQNLEWFVCLRHTVIPTLHHDLHPDIPTKARGMLQMLLPALEGFGWD